jgi:hypothetical protein
MAFVELNTGTAMDPGSEESGARMPGTSQNCNFKDFFQF